MYLANWSVHRIAAHQGWSESTARRRLRALGLDTTLKSSQRVLEWHRDEVIDQYRAQLSLAEIAQHHGVQPQAVRRALERWDEPVRDFRAGRTQRWRQRISSAKTLPLDEERLLALADGTRSCRDLAELLGVHEETVRQRLIVGGVDRLLPQARPEKNAFWRGGLTVDKHGYILVMSPRHPHRTKAGYVRQHRLVMESHLGRYLRPEEVVDHRNDDTSDNHIENLRLFASNAEHLAATLPGNVNLTEEEREARRREAVRRARQRVAAILAASGTDAPSSP